jgi:hypothetical protein
MEAYALPNQRAEMIAQTFVHEFIARFGCPLQMQIDQGRNFESELISEVCKLLQITKTRATPFHPSANGLVEQMNATLEKMILSFIDKNHKDWDLYLPLLMAAYRSTVHPATGYTPNMMMLGREVHLPVDIIFPIPQMAVPENAVEYVSELRSRLERCYHFGRQHLKQASERQKRNYDTRIKEASYKPGDLVYRLNPNKKKLEIPWMGPYVITKKLSDVVYRMVNKKRSMVIHHDQLKPYTAQVIPNWAHKVQRSQNR